MHDDMCEALEFINNEDYPLSVKAGEKNLVAGSDYTLYTGAKYTKNNEVISCTEKQNDGCDFHIVFSEIFLNSINADTNIVVTYYAKVNGNAVIAGDGNDNDARLDYYNNNKTEWDKTKTVTWEFDVFKFAAGKEDTELDGAKFVLSTKEGLKVSEIYQNGVVVDTAKANLISFTKSETETGIVYKVNPSGEDYIIEAGAANLEGLDEGTYYLYEVEAPAGYNMLTAPVKVEIRSSDDTTNKETHLAYEVFVNDAETKVDNAIVKIANNTGTELPSTGGIGTTIFYVVGGGLFVGAAVLLITKKRMGAK